MGMILAALNQIYPEKSPGKQRRFSQMQRRASIMASAISTASVRGKSISALEAKGFRRLKRLFAMADAVIETQRSMSASPSEAIVRG
jgi:hypothetical protein